MSLNISNTVQTPSKNSKLKVGIIGTGFGSLVHYPAYRQHREFDPIIIAGKDKEKTKIIADRLGIEFTTDWMEIINNPEIDIISIATPPKLHLEMTREAIKAGKHVICEKPLSYNLVDSEEMVSLIEDSGMTAMCNFEFRYLPCRSYFIELVKNGYIGDIYSFHININTNMRINPRTQGYNWWSNKTEGGGVLNALGSHYIDFLLQIFGDIKGVYGRKYINIPKRLNKKTGKMRNVTSDDAISVIFDIGEIQCTMQISTVVSHSKTTNIMASGSKGTLCIKEDQKVYGAIIGESNSLNELSIPLSYQLLREKNSHTLVPPFKKILDEFYKGINLGMSHSPNFSDGLRVQKIIDAINKSQTKKKYIPIK